MSRPRGATVVVTDTGTACGVAVVRSLREHGYRVVAVDHHRSAAGRWSRDASARALMTSTEDDANRAVDDLLAIARRHRAHLLIPATEKTAVALSARRDEVEATVPVALAASAAFELARDKQRTVALAETLGVPVPATAIATSHDEAVEAAHQLGWPVVLKPLTSHRSTATSVATQAVSIARSADELEAQLDAQRLPCLVQRFAGGHGEGVEVLAHEGRLLAAFQHRRLRELPPWGGMSALRESVELDPDLLAHTTSLMKALEWTGLAMVEFRVGPDGPTLMEINGRPWGSMALAVRAGMPFPALLADLFLSPTAPLDVPLRADYRPGVQCHHLGLELEWALWIGLRGAHRLGVDHRRRDALPALASLVDPRSNLDVQVLRDPVPGVLDAGHAVAEAARFALAGLRHR